ncbi:flavin reductase family protein [Zavarzinia sp. CC-PAN008]|uniref:flavin reductase family protein n=1 Tax=Zavarzinia sp. CC-PAN008 TaxID=3243332 RepID=UPI003F74AA1D
MLFDVSKIAPRDAYKLLVSTITPRPIAWVVSQDEAGLVNAAPFSFFNAVSDDPPLLVIGVNGPAGATKHKDTARNIAATKEYVICLVSEDTASAMNVTAFDFAPGVNELDKAHLTAVPSALVKPPRIAESPVAFECVEVNTYKASPTNSVILGRVVAIHIRDEFVLDAAKCYVDTPALKLIGRMHGTGWYTRTSDRFEMPRLTEAPKE